MMVALNQIFRFIFRMNTNEKAVFDSETEFFHQQPYVQV